MVKFAELNAGVTDAAAAASAHGHLRFGDFSLDLSKRALFRDAARIHLGSRAMSILMALIERPQQLISKQELVLIAWPTTFVEEGTLRVHIAAIRRALDDRPRHPKFIANVMGEGYRFIGKVDSVTGSLDQPRWKLTDSPNNATIAGRNLIGRDADAAALITLMANHRLISIVGPHGVGKSALATYVAPIAAQMSGRRLIQVDLADIAVVARLKSALADLGMSQNIDTPVGQLVLLDNCEGLARDVADLAETILDLTPSVAFIISSTEPLRAANERVYRLPPLASPARIDLTLREAVAFPAIQLLVERLAEQQHGIVVSEQDARMLLKLASKLDGYPLAIELAAAEVVFSGLSGALRHLEVTTSTERYDRSDIRHALIRGMLDRSESGLGETEREVLRRLAVFTASFGLDDAIYIAAFGNVTSSDVVTSVTNLAMNSQLARSRYPSGMRYRIPGHIRPYFRDALLKSEPGQVAGMRHAKWALDRAQDAAHALRHWTRTLFLETYTELADDLTEAIALSLATVADEDFAPVLLLAAIPTLLCCSRHLTVCAFVAKVLESHGTIAPRQLLQLKLLQAVIQKELTAEPIGDNSVVEVTRSLRQSVADDTAESETFLVEAMLLLRQGRIAAGLECAELAAAHARTTGDRSLEATTIRLSAELLHYSARHEEFDRTTAKALFLPTTLSPLFGTITSHPQSGLKVFQARELWLTGSFDQAWTMATAAFELAKDNGASSKCETLALGLVPVLLWGGDHEEAADAAEQLGSIAARHDLPHWVSWSSLYRNVERLRAAGENSLSADIVTPCFTSFLQAETWMTVAGGLPGAIRPAIEPLAWCAPEFMRVEALALWRSGNNEAAEARFLEARQSASKSGLLAWELRISLSLAEFWRPREPTRAADILAGTLGKVSEGAGTFDVLAARTLIADLGQPGNDSRPLTSMR